MRIILFAGKGGVGKTSVACATGLAAARRGMKTLVMSLDVAHNLSDILDLPKDLLDQNEGLPQRIEENYWIQELDIQRELDRHWSEIYGYLRGLFSATGVDEVAAEELAIIPGMEEISSLLYINQYSKGGTFDVIILDCAPTGESMRFISMPSALDWYMRKIFKMERNILRVTRPVVRAVSSVPVPDDDYFESIQGLYEKLRGVDLLLSDPRITSVRLVTNPEKVVIKETQRAYMYFSLYGINVDAVIVNRVLPPCVPDGYLSGWRRIQEGYLRYIEEAFTPLPIMQAPLFEKEVVGKEDLLRLQEAIYGERDPTEVFRTERPYRIYKFDGRYCLEVLLPFVKKDHVDLLKRGDEIVISVGTYRQHLLLPKSVAGHEPSRASISGNQLRIFFGREDDEQEGRAGKGQTRKGP
jgi:arsenite-transporting ATPase